MEIPYGNMITKLLPKEHTVEHTKMPWKGKFTVEHIVKAVLSLSPNKDPCCITTMPTLGHGGPLKETNYNREAIPKFNLLFISL
jgi:hypothetical protein